MRPRALIPLAAVLLAALFGWREYQRGGFGLPGVTPPAATSPAPPVPGSTEPIDETSPGDPGVGSTTADPPAERAPETAEPAPAEPPADSAPPPAAAVPPPAGGYPEAQLRSRDVNPIVNLRPERAEILSAYANGAFARTIALADAWLNSRPTDALVALARNNALQRQLGRETVVIGLSVPTSGASVQAGEAILQGVNMAVQEANAAGGVRGRRVIVAVRNDQNDRELAVEAATELYGNDDVLGVVGPVGSSATLAAAAIYSNGLPQLAPTATSDRLASAGDYTFRLAPPDAAQGKALARLARERGYSRVPVYFDPDDASSKSLADAFLAEARRIELSAVPFEFRSGELPVQDGFDTFFDPPVPDAAFIAGGYSDVAAIARALRERGQDVPLLAGDAAYSQQLLREGGEAVEGLTFTSFFHASSEVGDVPTFTRAFRNRYGGGTPNARAAQAYDATRTLIEAIRRAPTLDRDGVQSALGTFTPERPGPGVTSDVVFRDGAIVGRPYVVIQVRDGALVATDVVR